MSVRLLVVEHHDGCPPALLGDWLTEAGATLDVRRPYADDDLPASLADHDGLLVLGGPQDAGDPAHPWLVPTRALVLDAEQRERPALGVCLGHQLCALAFGGHVDRHPGGQQVGLLDVGWTPEAHDDPLLGRVARTPGAQGVHWNDDVVVQVPDDAVVLARSAGGAVQALRFAPHVWGVQWHPEVDEPILRSWAEEDAERHLERGIDQEAALAEVAVAREQLAATWRQLAHDLVALCAGRPA